MAFSEITGLLNLRAVRNALPVVATVSRQFACDVTANPQLPNDNWVARKDFAATTNDPNPDTIRRPVGVNIEAYNFGHVSVVCERSHPSHVINKFYYTERRL